MIGNPSYPTFQIFLAVLVAMLIVLAVMPLFIRLMLTRGVGQQIRADGPQRHLVKQGTPTMGGAVMLVAVVITCILVSRFSLRLGIALAATLATGALGLLDDIESVAHKRSLGLTPSQKMVGLALISLIFTLVAVNVLQLDSAIEFPGGARLDLGVLTTELTLGSSVLRIPWLYLAFVFLLFAGMANSVNLTDGLDGLAGGTVLIVMIMMAAVAFRYGESDLAIFAGAIAGSCIGFLWFNAYPASIFMGDTGALALGAAFAALAVLTKTEVTSLVMGGLFIAESLSVIIQVISFKSTGKRVFLMSPIHHHFEKLGWAETKVVTRFWIVSGFFSALGFALWFLL